METSLLADLSRGCYQEMEFVHMEQTILQALKWRVNGPTQLGFVTHFMALMPSAVHPAVKNAIFDYARYQTELAVAEHALVSAKPSEVALAAVLNAVEGMDMGLFPLKLQGKFLRSIERHSEMFVSDVEHIQSHLSLLLVSLLGNFDDIMSTVTDAESVQDDNLLDDKPVHRRNSPVSVIPQGRARS